MTLKTKSGKIAKDTTKKSTKRSSVVEPSVEPSVGPVEPVKDEPVKVELVKEELPVAEELPVEVPSVENEEPVFDEDEPSSKRQKKIKLDKPLINNAGDYLNPLTNRYVKTNSQLFKKLVRDGIILPVDLDLDQSVDLDLDQPLE